MSLFICYKLAAWATFSVSLQPWLLRLKHVQNICYLYGYFSFLRLKHVQNICYLSWFIFTNCLVFRCFSVPDVVIPDLLTLDPLNVPSDGHTIHSLKWHAPNVELILLILISNLSSLTFHVHNSPNTLYYRYGGNRLTTLSHQKPYSR
jgi:hypothetical protein